MMPKTVFPLSSFPTAWTPGARSSKGLQQGPTKLKAAVNINRELPRRRAQEAAKMKSTFQVATQIGWFDDLFVLPDRVYPPQPPIQGMPPGWTNGLSCISTPRMRRFIPASLPRFAAEVARDLSALTEQNGNNRPPASFAAGSSQLASDADQSRQSLSRSSPAAFANRTRLLLQSKPGPDGRRGTRPSD